jgi:hypothetical protein
MNNKMVNYRILNLEGSWFDLETLDNKDKVFTYKTGIRKYIKDGVEKDFKVNANKLFTATMPSSLETYRAFKAYKDEVLNKELNIASDNEMQQGQDLYTKLFVNFKFSKDFWEDGEDEDNVKKIKKKRLRKLIYTSTVKIDDIEYCFFKRGASKARTSNVIFCKKEFCEKLLRPSMLGLKFEYGKEYDITSMQAYASLIMSGIIDIIKIPRDSILIIDDIYSKPFNAKQTVTKIEDGKVYQDNEGGNDGQFEVVNNMSDGQILLDESIYLENESLSKATCALLRNDFFKGNAVRTRIQKYYSDNSIKKVWDKFRGWIDASKIKLVITPSACKYLKFSDQFETEKACFEDWLMRVPEEFGLVKIDHEGVYNFSNRLSYQMLNSMNLSKEEVRQLVDDDLKYLKLLKDNTLATSQDIRKMTAKNKKINRERRNEMSYFIDLVHSKKDSLGTSSMLSALLDRNSNFRFTKKFKDWKNEQIQDYIENLRLGKIRIQNSIYAILVSCPYEMLLATTKQKNIIQESMMKGYECYCPSFATKKGDKDVELIGIRNPQINAGNIVKFTQKYHDEFKYFGYYEDDKARHFFVVFVNTWDCDLMNRGQGLDFDIDAMYLSDNELLVKKAQESQQWATPVNGIEGMKAKKKYCYKNLAELDSYLGGSTMAIGKIVNKSAIFNAYMYHAINNGYDESYINACFEASSMLSSCSQIAIDMAKKNFQGVSLTNIMNYINKQKYKDRNDEQHQILKFEFDIATKIVSDKDYDKKDDKCIKRVLYKYDMRNKTGYRQYEIVERKMIVPYFFKYIAKDNAYRIPTKMDCAMDYLQEILDDFDTKAIKTNLIEIKDLVISQRELYGNDFSRSSIDNVRKIIDQCNRILNKNRYDSADGGEDTISKSNLRRYAKKLAINELKNLNLNEKTIYRIVIRALDSDVNYNGQDMYVLNNDSEEIEFTNKKGEKRKLMVQEFKEMSMITLNLIYQAYSDIFLKCFEENKMRKVKLNRFWI